MTIRGLERPPRATRQSPAPAQVLLRHLGIEVEDPALVDQSFTLIERRLEELESLYRRGRAS